ncbi:MAG: carboxylating nicotinate-nucleotide diphosphorylase [Pseudomonadales bacterium]
MLTDDIIERAVADNVRVALLEDIGSGDVTAELIPESADVNAIIITRENMVVCGGPWVDRVFSELDSNIEVKWNFDEGQQAHAGDTLLTLRGNARLLLTGERTALNFLQLLSGTASTCQEYAELVAHTEVKLLDTRKTIPGLRIAQKYAAKTGGCFNHRIGLFDAFLIKENHIAACGSINAAVQEAREQKTNVLIEVEVENFEQLEQAINADADRIMLDNFSVADMRTAVAQVAGKIDLEASGNITRASIADYAETGVDYISIGALTKHCRAKDLSMRLEGTF